MFCVIFFFTKIVSATLRRSRTETELHPFPWLMPSSNNGTKSVYPHAHKAYSSKITKKTNPKQIKSHSKVETKMLRRLFTTSRLCAQPHSTCVSVAASVRGCSSSSSASFDPVVIGATKLGTKSADDSFCRMSDIASASSTGGGATGGVGGGGRISAGDILGMMDLCACNVARHHITGKYRFASNAIASGQPVSVATVAVDHTPFTAPVMSGDTIVCEGRMVHAGNTSMGVALEVFRAQFPTRRRTKVCHSFFSLVAIDNSLAKAPVVPALALTTPRDVALNKVYKKELALGKLQPRERLEAVAREAAENAVSRPQSSASSSSSSVLSTVDAPTPYSSAAYPNAFDAAADLECAPNKTKRFKVPFEETRVEANRVFFPQFLNVNKTIFGGELMRWMEAQAVQCGRMFTANKDVRTLGMYNVVFNDAVHVQDWVSLNAHVVYVHRTTLEVEVEIEVERAEKVVTNKASFVLASFDDAGLQMEVGTGLELAGAGERWRSRYADARARYEVGRLTRRIQSRVFNSSAN